MIFNLISILPLTFSERPIRRSCMMFQTLMRHIRVQGSEEKKKMLDKNRIKSSLVVMWLPLVTGHQVTAHHLCSQEWE